MEQGSVAQEKNVKLKPASKIACPNCGQYKLMRMSPAKWCLYILVFGNIFIFVPIIGWLLAIPMLIADIGLIPATIILYCMPKMRHLTLKCRACKWNGEESEAVETVHKAPGHS